MTIGGQTFTVNQDGVSCSYTLAPISGSFGANGGTGTVSVTTASGCAWTAVSNDDWIVVTVGATGSGTGTVSYTVGTNESVARAGTMTIAGQNFPVSQSEASRSSKVGVFREGVWFLDNGNVRFDSVEVETIGSFGLSGDMLTTGKWETASDGRAVAAHGCSTATAVVDVLRPAGFTGLASLVIHCLPVPGDAGEPGRVCLA